MLGRHTLAIGTWQSGLFLACVQTSPISFHGWKEIGDVSPTVLHLRPQTFPLDEWPILNFVFEVDFFLSSKREVLFDSSLKAQPSPKPTNNA